jgi:hypothetical protein
MRMVIYGASDDLLEVESEEFVTEFDVYGPTEVLVEDREGNSLLVKAEFGASGRMKADWTLGIENTAYWPKDWTIQFGERPDREDDPAIILDVPEGTTVRELS